MSRITSGNIKNNTRKKFVYNPADLEAAFSQIWQCTAKKVAARK